MNVLNPKLYADLLCKYRHVGIVSPGEQAQVSYRPSYSAGKARLSIQATGGEYYKVNCPFCGDTRQRLNFSHLFGTRDVRTGQQLFQLATCFNEDCMDWETGKQLYESLVARRQRRRGRLAPSAEKAAAVASPPAPPKTISLPGSCVSIASLDSRHIARRYLESRDFNIDELWQRWRVLYCDRDLDARPKIRSRIVVPIYNRKLTLSGEGAGGPKWQLAGWQARVVSDQLAEDCPKYLTAAGMPKASLLYGLPHAVNGTGPVVIVEGVTDVWRLGRDAVATFGKTMSLAQERLIVAMFPGRPLVIAYDRDAEAENGIVCAKLRGARAGADDKSPVSILRLPAKRKDIGECSRAEAWNLVQQATPRVRQP